MARARYYRMDERSDGGSGGIKNSSGNGYHGTATNMDAVDFLTKGHDRRVGSAISFDGSDQYIDLGTLEANFFSIGFTVLSVFNMLIFLINFRNNKFYLENSLDNVESIENLTHGSSNI